MRTMWLFLAGMLIPALLVGLGGAALAQNPEVDLARPHAVSGKITFDGTYRSYTPSEDELSRRGVGWKNTSSFDDARLSGRMWSLLNRDTLLPRPPAHVWSGTTRIENDGGSWVGTLYGYLDPGVRLEYLFHQLTGQGAY